MAIHKTILLVEDNEGDQFLIKEALTEAEIVCDVMIANSGEEALEKVKTLRPGLVITDTNMPGMNGFETCQRIKELLPDVKVIICTGVVDAIDVARAREAGADDYCVKIASCEPLINAIRSFVKDDSHE